MVVAFNVAFYRRIPVVVGPTLNRTAITTIPVAIFLTIFVCPVNNIISYGYVTAVAFVLVPHINADIRKRELFAVHGIVY